MFENDHFQNCVYFGRFVSAETTMHCKRHISVGSFVYNYDQWPHDSYMTGRAGVWEADDIVKFYIALLDFLPATL